MTNNCFAPIATQTMEVTRTYLEMLAPSKLHAARSDDSLIKIEKQVDCSIELFRDLYREVGKNYFWIDRLPWTDEQIKTYLQQPGVSLWLMTYDGDIAGYFELQKEANNLYRVKSLAADIFACIVFAVYCFLGQLIINIVSPSRKKMEPTK